MIGPATSGAAQAATAPGASRDQAQLRAAAEAFEAVFLRQVIGSMRQAKLGEDLFGSAATDQFRDMADGQLADSMAGQGSFGIADLLLQQFGRNPRQAGSPAAAPAAPTNQNSGGAAE
ncbi:MAG TPA: rod-binding protein [Allosphingosinicella sp.]